jgi:F-type H+-transporting ATPase subunit delta
MTGPVAKRYARALFALASEKGKVEAIGEELGRAVGAFGDEKLAAVARSAAVDMSAKREIARQVAARLGVSHLVASFLGLLAERNRLGFLEAIGERYGRLVDESLGRVRARIVSARPLSDADRQRITKLFEEKTGKKVLAELEVDPDLLGGVLVEVGGRVYDGSVRTQLETIKSALAG